MFKSRSVPIFLAVVLGLAALLAIADLFGPRDRDVSVAAARSSTTRSVSSRKETSALGEKTSAAVTPSAPSACRADDVQDIAYLNFWPPIPGASPGTQGSMDELVAKLGTTGDNTARQLAVGVGVPVWVQDESAIALTIKESFDAAKRTNVAVHFYIDDHIGWDQRPDLWNWNNPAARGYSSENKKNVEWYDWKGTANKRRYLTPVGSPSQSPHMCYNSKRILQEIGRIIQEIIGPAFREELVKLKQENKEYLFAGVTVGAEAGFDDYSVVPTLDKIPLNPDPRSPLQMQIAKTAREAAHLMEQDQAPHGRLGYCALTNAGYREDKPPENFDRALADVNQKFIEFWDKQLFDAGIPCSRIYTHVAGPAPQDKDAPLKIAFNAYARPGWTTYPIEILEHGFQPLYDELAKHGNPVWGGVEANAVFPKASAISARVSWEQYLGWHYNHGAKLVGVNLGASEQTLRSHLAKGAFGHNAIAAYKKFLNGAPLSEAATTTEAAASDDSNDTTSVPLPAEPPRSLIDRMQMIQSETPAWLKSHPDRELELGRLFQRLDQRLKANDFIQAQVAADVILRMLGVAPPTN